MSPDYLLSTPTVRWTIPADPLDSSISAPAKAPPQYLSKLRSQKKLAFDFSLGIIENIGVIQYRVPFVGHGLLV